MITFHAMDKQGKIVPSGMPDEIQARVDGVMGQIDAVFPWFWEAMEKIGLNFCYMVDGEVEGIPRGSDVTTNSGFDLARALLYFDEPGSRLSLPHELGHVLDVYSGRDLFARSLTLVYPKPMSASDLLANWLASIGGKSDAGVFIRAITSARIASDPEKRRVVLANMLGGGVWEGADVAINDFVQERWANLFEQFVHFSLRSMGDDALFFNSEAYVSEVMWDDDYMAGMNDRLGTMFRRSVKGILHTPKYELDAKKDAYGILARRGAK